MKKALALCGLLSLIAAGCALTPKDTGTAYMFALTPVKVATGAKSTEASLVVSQPITAPQLDTYRVALLKKNSVWDYYAGARWADFLPVLVQDNLIKTLEDSQLFKTIQSDQSRLRGHYILKSEIREFQAEYERPGALPQVRIKIAVTLSDRSSEKSFIIGGLKTATADSLDALQAAFADAFTQAQKQMIGTLNFLHNER